jgi:hypothetical protein
VVEVYGWGSEIVIELARLCLGMMIFARKGPMFSPVDGVSDGDTLRLYNFVLDKLKQHLVRHNFCEVAMPVQGRCVLRVSKKVFMYGPMTGEQVPTSGDWLRVSTCVIEQPDVCSVVMYAHFLKIFDSFFHDVLAAEDYILVLTFAPTVHEEERTALCDLLALLSVNHTTKGACQAVDMLPLTFEFVSCRNPQERFCYGGGSINVSDEGVRGSIAMMRLVALAEHQRNKLMLRGDRQFHLVVPLTNQQVPLALLLIHELHAHGLAIDFFFQERSDSDYVHYAQICGARCALAIGPEEQTSGTVLINDLLKGQTQVIVQREVSSFLRHLSITSND